MFPRGSDPHAQRLAVVRFAARCGYPAHPDHASSPWAAQGEAVLATEWLNDWRGVDGEWWGWNGSDWGRWPVA